MELRTMIDADQRLAMLQVLEQDPDYSHNSRVLKQALGVLGHNIGTDLSRNHISWLEEQGLVTVDRDGVADLWIVKLTLRGEDVALGRTVVPGVARPRPR